MMDNQPLIVTKKQEFQKIINYLHAGTTPLTTDTIQQNLNTNFTLTKKQIYKELQVSGHWLIYQFLWPLKAKINKFYCFL